MAGLRHILTLSAILVLVDVGYSQAPSLRCLAVDSNGNVTISWTAPSDSCGVFTEYQIFYSASQAGPYNLIGTVTDFNTTTYVDLAAGANLGSVYYYVVSNSGCASNSSDTLQSIFLTVSNSVSGVANLSWNSMHVPQITDSVYYILFKEDTVAGAMLFLDSIFQSNFYTDSITVCDDTLDYQLFLMDSTGCISSSSIALYTPDGLQPNGVVIDSVSVDPASGLAILSWTATGSADVIGYNIYVADTPPFWTLVGFVSGANNTVYTDPFSGAIVFPGPPLRQYSVDSGAVIYNVAAIDKCGNESFFLNGFNTIHLSGVLDTCVGEAELSWNSFVNWPSGVLDYDLFLSTDGGTYNLVSSTSGTSYTHTGLQRSSTYCYFVRANNGAGTKSSSSNLMCSYMDTIGDSGVSFQVFVEARDSVINYITWTEDPSWAPFISRYDIYRSVDGGGFQLIGDTLFGSTTFIDSLDPLSDFRYTTGYFCYFVVPVKTGGNIYACVDTSSIECVSQFPKYVVANAFTPNGDGLNDVFRPIRVFVARDNYLMIIYTRWGQKVFETTDPDLGWDGLIKGFVGANDAYVYYVEFTVKGLEPRIKAGTVMLLR
ncbi:MAG: hypothetical protein COB85_00235 [Bacteroidetes bacterium]|nr:MAG: hypothetical protein COB85_00235 [Bacteroidota bacterium]